MRGLSASASAAGPGPGPGGPAAAAAASSAAPEHAAAAAAPHQTEHTGQRAEDIQYWHFDEDVYAAAVVAFAAAAAAPSGTSSALSPDADPRSSSAADPAAAAAAASASPRHSDELEHEAGAEKTQEEPPASELQGGGRSRDRSSMPPVPLNKVVKMLPSRLDAPPDDCKQVRSLDLDELKSLQTVTSDAAAAAPSPAPHICVGILLQSARLLRGTQTAGTCHRSEQIIQVGEDPVTQRAEHLMRSSCQDRTEQKKKKKEKEAQKPDLDAPMSPCAQPAATPQKSTQAKAKSKAKASGNELHVQQMTAAIIQSSPHVTLITLAGNAHLKTNKKQANGEFAPQKPALVYIERGAAPPQQQMPVGMNDYATTPIGIYSSSAGATVRIRPAEGRCRCSPRPAEGAPSCSCVAKPGGFHMYDRFYRSMPGGLWRLEWEAVYTIRVFEEPKSASAAAAAAAAAAGAAVKGATGVAAASPRGCKGKSMSRSTSNKERSQAGAQTKATEASAPSLPAAPYALWPHAFPGMAAGVPMPPPLPQHNAAAASAAAAIVLSPAKSQSKSAAPRARASSKRGATEAIGAPATSKKPRKKKAKGAAPSPTPVPATHVSAVAVVGEFLVQATAAASREPAPSQGAHLLSLPPQHQLAAGHSFPPAAASAPTSTTMASAGEVPSPFSRGAALPTQLAQAQPPADVGSFFSAELTTDAPAEPHGAAYVTARDAVVATASFPPTGLSSPSGASPPDSAVPAWPPTFRFPTSADASDVPASAGASASDGPDSSLEPLPRHLRDLSELHTSIAAAANHSFVFGSLMDPPCLHQNALDLQAELSMEAAFRAGGRAALFSEYFAMFPAQGAQEAAGAQRMETDEFTTEKGSDGGEMGAEGVYVHAPWPVTRDRLTLRSFSHSI